MTSLVVPWLLGMGCVHSHHMTLMSDVDAQEPVSQARRVESEATQVVRFGIAKDTQFAVDAYRDLGAACPNGTVTGIQTRYSTDLGFFSWEHHVVMWGYCFE